MEKLKTIGLYQRKIIYIIDCSVIRDNNIVFGRLGRTERVVSLWFIARWD